MEPQELDWIIETQSVENHCTNFRHFTLRRCTVNESHCSVFIELIYFSKCFQCGELISLTEGEVNVPVGGSNRVCAEKGII